MPLPAHADPLPAALYLVGTPIGHLEDITLRALATLRGVAAILAEDTRHTRILLDRYQIRAPLLSAHRFNEAARAPGVVARIGAGQAVALVTNAGMPGVCDPGSRLVTACRQAGLTVTAVPGPSSVTAAVALSGFGGGGFRCEGFLPRTSGARRNRLDQLRHEAMPVVILESPYRFLAVLSDLNALLPERGLFVGRELTKLHEECLWGTAADLYRRLSECYGGDTGRAPKGELVLVLAPAGRPAKPADRGTP